MLKAAHFRNLLAILLTLACGWKIIDLVVVQGAREYPFDGRQPVSLYTFLKDIKPLVPRIPNTGVLCYAGSSAAGLSPRPSYIWTLYALAPRIVVPWGNRVHEEGPGLKTVAPSLLWSRAFNEANCDYLLVHKLGNDAPAFLPPHFGQGLEFKSGSVDMVLYTRQKP